MRSGSFFWYVFPFTLMFTAVTTGLVFYFSSQNQSQFFFDKTEVELEKQAKIFQRLVEENMSQARYGEAQQQAIELGKQTRTRYTLILSDGRVVVDSDQPPEKMENYANRPEVSDALSGRMGLSTRYSYTLKKNLVYVALPVFSKQGSVSWVMRTSRPAEDLRSELRLQRNRNLIILIVVLGLASVLAFFWARHLANPISRLTSHIEELATGNLGARFDGRGVVPKELSHVVSSLDRMAGEFDSHRSQALQSQMQQGAILGNMEEGVIAVDENGRITHLNRAAAEILDVSPVDKRSMTVPELIRLPYLRKFIEKSLKKDRRREREVVLNEGESNEKIFIVRSNPVKAQNGSSLGAIFVVLDVTELRRLERHRQDFVSNVSHELKTPLTSIKGFAETMMNPALGSVEELRNFAQIILNQADQLDTLIEDLLTLSKLENEIELEGDEDEQIAVSQWIQSAIEVCQAKAKEKRTVITVDASVEATVMGKPGLLVQALVNLVDNAIKYSPEHSEVQVLAARSNVGLMIEVVDQGPGISEGNVPHLFERFYRVDKGRSRDMGGTGLGLSIVKHIMNVHRGEARVESEIGVGSRFMLIIPPELIKS